MIRQQMKFGEWLMLVTLSLVWGGSFFFNGVAVAELPVLTIVLGRVGFAAMALFVFMKWAGLAMPVGRQIWQAFFWMGFLNNVIPFGLIVWAQGYVTSGYASIINATTPLFAVLVAHFATDDEALTLPKLTGVLLGFTGVALLVGPDAFAGMSFYLGAQLALLMAALSYGVAVSFGRRFRRLGVSPIATATGQITASTILLIPIVALVDRPWSLPMPGGGVVLSVIGLALLSTAFAYFLYFRILETAGATNLSLVTLLVPVSAIALGVFFLDEILLIRHLIGMMVIGLGLLAIDGRILRLLARLRHS